MLWIALSHSHGTRVIINSYTHLFVLNNIKVAWLTSSSSPMFPATTNCDSLTAQRTFSAFILLPTTGWPDKKVQSLLAPGSCPNDDRAAFHGWRTCSSICNQKFRVNHKFKTERSRSNPNLTFKTLKQTQIFRDNPKNVRLPVDDKPTTRFCWKHSEYGNSPHSVGSPRSRIFHHELHSIIGDSPLPTTRDRKKAT